MSPQTQYGGLIAVTPKRSPGWPEGAAITKSKSKELKNLFQVAVAHRFIQKSPEEKSERRADGEQETTDREEEVRR